MWLDSYLLLTKLPHLLTFTTARTVSSDRVGLAVDVDLSGSQDPSTQRRSRAHITHPIWNQCTEKAANFRSVLALTIGEAVNFGTLYKRNLLAEIHYTVCSTYNALEGSQLRANETYAIASQNYDRVERGKPIIDNIRCVCGTSVVLQFYTTGIRVAFSRPSHGSLSSHFLLPFSRHFKPLHAALLSAAFSLLSFLQRHI